MAVRVVLLGVCHVLFSSRRFTISVGHGMRKVLSAVVEPRCNSSLRIWP